MKDRVVVDELQEYFKYPCEDFESCKPLQWWLGWQSQFPNLYRLVFDVFSIPGKHSLMFIGLILLILVLCRLCRSCGTYILRWPWYNLSVSSKFDSRYHSGPHAGQAAPSTCSYHIAEGWLTLIYFVHSCSLQKSLFFISIYMYTAIHRINCRPYHEDCKLVPMAMATVGPYP